MALILADRVRETSTVSGTSNASLLGAVVGFQPFVVVGNGNTTYYCISGQGTNEWEVGIGTYTATGAVLSRDTVLSNSAGTEPTKLNFTAGPKDVFCTYPAEKSVYLDAAGNVSTLGTLATLAVSGTVNFTGATVTNGGSVTTVDINGGSVDGTPIGATTPSTVASTNLSYTGTLTGGTGVINIGSGQVYKDASGNLGIGTASPGNKFHVVAATQADDNGLIRAENTATTGAKNASFIAKNYYGASQFMQWESNGLRIGSRTVANAGAGDVIFTAGSDVERMRITSAGDVGIGTSSIGDKLEVAVNTVNGSGIRVTNSSSATYTTFQANGATGSGVTGWANSVVLEAIPASGGNLVFSSYSGAMVFQTGTGRGERMRIDSSGDLLVGTTTALAALTVNGNIAPVATPSTKWGIDFAPSTSSGTFVSIANDGTYDLIAGSGQVYIYDNDGNGVASVMVYYGVVAIQFQDGSLYTNGKNTAGKINFYFNGTTAYQIQNKTGATRNLFISTIRCRTSA